MDLADLVEPESAEDGRSASDLATLLAELGRVVKGRAFYEPGDAKLASLFRRGFRAWQGDLKRHGALELEIRPTGFWSSRPRSAIRRRELGGLAAELSARGLRRVRFEAELEAEAFAAFIELLASDRAVIEARGGFGRALYARAPAGIVVNGLLPEPAAKEQGPAEGAPVEGGCGAPVLELTDEVEAPSSATDPDPSDTPDRAPGPEGAGELRESPREKAHRPIEERDEAPVELAIPDAGSGELASECVSGLARGVRLEDLIDRASAPGAEASVQATQVLLQLGEGAIPALLTATELEPDPDRRGRMDGILIAMGEKILPWLLEAMRGAEPSRVRNAIRIAAESRIPGAVPRLAEILVGENSALREEAAKALARIGDPGALEGLASVMRSDIADLPALAARSLAASASPRAVDALLRAMREAIQSRQPGLAREAIGALGRLARPEATGALAELLLSRSLLRRRRLRELRIAAASALGRIPGDDAVGALAQAARSRDGQLRRAAQTALDRRAQALSGGRAGPDVS
jgi:HEAT repeat protein